MKGGNIKKKDEPKSKYDKWVETLSQIEDVKLSDDEWEKVMANIPTHTKDCRTMIVGGVWDDRTPHHLRGAREVWRCSDDCPIRKKEKEKLAERVKAKKAKFQRLIKRMNCKHKWEEEIALIRLVPVRIKVCELCGSVTNDNKTSSTGGR